MQNLCENLVAQGEQVSCLVHNHEYSLRLREENINGVSVHRTPVVGRLLFTPLAPLYPFHLIRLMRKFKPDVLHVHMPNVSAFWLLIFNLIYRNPIIIHWHSDVIGAAPMLAIRFAYIFYWPFERCLLMLGKRVIVTSANYGESSKPLEKFQHKITVVPLALPDLPDHARDSSPDSLLTRSNLSLICVGRLTYYKGHSVLLDAISKLPQTTLVIVGDGEEKARITRRIEKLELCNRVKLAGHIDSANLNSMLNDCDCLVLPSIERTEAFGLVLLEAMRARKPVIASNIPGSGIGWVVQQNVTGMLVEPGSATSLAAAIRQLLEAPDLCTELGANGRKRFLELFTVERVANKIEAVYKEVALIPA